MKRTLLTFSLIIAAACAFACGSTSETDKPNALRTGNAPSSNPQFAETPAANTSSPVAGTIYPITGRESEAEKSSLAGESKASDAELKTKDEHLEMTSQATPQASPHAQNQTSRSMQEQTTKPAATSSPTH